MRIFLKQRQHSSTAEDSSSRCSSPLEEADVDSSEQISPEGARQRPRPDAGLVACSETSATALDSPSLDRGGVTDATAESETGVSKETITIDCTEFCVTSSAVAEGLCTDESATNSSSAQFEQKSAPLDSATSAGLRDDALPSSGGSSFTNTVIEKNNKRPHSPLPGGAPLDRKPPHIKKIKPAKGSDCIRQGDSSRPRELVQYTKPGHISQDDSNRPISIQDMGRGHNSFSRRAYRTASHDVSNEAEQREVSNSFFYNVVEENDPASASLNQQSDFEVALKKHGLEIQEQEGDGNCLFRAVSLQVYGDPSMHEEVRKKCIDFMAKDEGHFSQFVTGEPFREYIERKRKDGVHGNNPEIQAISELFNRPVEVYVPEHGGKPINIFHAEYKTADTPIRLSYHDGNHYNAVIDPLYPTAGLGLGFPGLEPGLADRRQVAKAVVESDKLADEVDFAMAIEQSHDDQVEKAIMESKLAAQHIYEGKAIALSDIEATNFELEQAMLASSMDSYRRSEISRKQAGTNDSARSPEQGCASMPSTRGDTSAMSVAASPRVAVASAASAESSSDEYPQTVQELVMNGFDLSKVLRAYDLVGDNFDDMLAFLMSTQS